MELFRMFTTTKYKGKRGYLKTQKFYEILRTIIYFGISLSLFLAGYFTTNTRMNLLTVVAIIGCLPACKSAVEMIMYLKYKGCSDEAAEYIDEAAEGLSGLYDMVFTAYDKTYIISHMVIRGNTICGFTEDEGFDEQAFYKHIDVILKTDNFKDTSVKIFKDINKYSERLLQLKNLDANENNSAGIENNSAGIIETLKSVSL